MKTATLYRQPSTDQGTFGRLALDGLELVTLELPWRDNQRRISCIPAGVYICTLQASHMWTPRSDGRVYHVQDVPGRDAILIHAANWAGDVSQHWHSDLLGCIAPGRTRCRLAPQCTGVLQDAVAQTREALTDFMNALGGEDFALEIVGQG